MFFTRFQAVHLNLGICHGSFKYQMNSMISPYLRHIKFIFISSLFFGYAFRKRLSVKFNTILKLSESLCFPARRYFNFCPFTGIQSFSTIKIPIYSIFSTFTRKIMGNGRRCCLLLCFRTKNNSSQKHA
jgi:hypothetical protein